MSDDASRTPTIRQFAVSLVMGGVVAVGTLSIPPQSSLAGILIGAAGLGVAILVVFGLQVGVVILGALRETI